MLVSSDLSDALISSGNILSVSGCRSFRSDQTPVLRCPGDFRHCCHRRRRACRERFCPASGLSARRPFPSWPGSGLRSWLSWLMSLTIIRPTLCRNEFAAETRDGTALSSVFLLFGEVKLQKKRPTGPFSD